MFVLGGNHQYTDKKCPNLRLSIFRDSTVLCVGSWNRKHLTVSTCDFKCDICFSESEAS